MKVEWSIIVVGSNIAMSAINPFAILPLSFKGSRWAGMPVILLVAVSKEINEFSLTYLPRIRG